MRWACLAAGLAVLSIGVTAAHADLKISSAATQNVTCSNGTCTATAKNAVLNATDLTNMLTSADVTVQSGGVAQDIEINASLSWTSSARLTLDSYHSITFNKPLVVAGTGALTITTNDGGSGGDYHFLNKGHVKFWDLASSLIIDGQQYVLVNRIKNMKRRCFVALAQPIDAADHPYSSSPLKAFTGTLEGLGNSISNLTIADQRAGDSVAFIGDLQGTSCDFVNVVRDIRFVGANISANDDSNAGILVGENSFGMILGSFGSGRVSAGQRAYSGGLVGRSVSGTIEGSSATVDVTGGAMSSVGGLLGSGEGFCESTCEGILDESVATGSVQGGANSSVGGLVGFNNGATVSDSYSAASVSGSSDAKAGGLVGSNADKDVNSPAFVRTSYSTGPVSGDESLVGGSIGSDTSTSAGISNAYWNLDTSGVSNPHQGAGNVPDDPGITGLTDAQLKSGLPAGFDKHIWKQNPKINDGYPYLVDNPPR